MDADEKLTREHANLALVRRLEDLAYNYPNLRFGQILSIFGFVENEKISDDVTGWRNGPWRDEFYLESEELLSRVKQYRDRQRLAGT